MRIVVDWGTSRLRVRLVDDAGRTVEALADGRGIATVAPGDHETVLRSLVDPWLERHPSATVLAFGMVTSRDGWVEVPYVPCPFDAAALAAGSVERTLGGGTRIRFLPGARDEGASPYPDVMRGEETELVGCEARSARAVVLPGTHSKWARVEDGAVRGFRTAMTGELHALLVAHAFVGRGGDGAEARPDAFVEAVDLARDADDGLLTTLFGARTGRLAGRLGSGDVAEHLSGTLIGHEIRSAIEAGRCAPGEPLAVVGTGALAERYARAADRFGIEARIDADDAGTRGALAVAAHLERDCP